MKLIKKHLSSALFALTVTSQAHAEGITTGTYETNMLGGCSVLVINGAGPAGNSYIWDKGCDGRADYKANRVKVTSRGIDVDQARIRRIVTDPKGFTGDWSLRGQTTKGVIFTRQ